MDRIKRWSKHRNGWNGKGVVISWEKECAVVEAKEEVT
jgi:hypothetical protein